MGHIQTPVETSNGDVGLISGVPVRGVEDAEGPPGELEEGDFRCNVIFGEDLRKPAFGDVNITVTVEVRHVVWANRRRNRGDRYPSGPRRQSICVGCHYRRSKPGGR